MNLNGPPATAAGARAIVRQVQRTFADRTDHDPGWFAAKTHLAFARNASGRGGRSPIESRQAPHEVVDHAVGVGMIDVEAVELAVGRQIDAGLPLDVEDHAGRVDERLLAGECGQPLGDGIRSDGRGENGGHRCRGVSARDGSDHTQFLEKPLPEPLQCW